MAVGLSKPFVGGSANGAAGVHEVSPISYSAFLLALTKAN